MLSTRYFGAAMFVAAATVSFAAELSNEEREQFLRNAPVVSRKTLSMGVTGSVKAVLDNGSMQHAAHVQTVDISKPRFETTRGVEIDFRDSYKYNLAAYQLAKLLQIPTVPVSVERRVDGSSAAVTWWVDDVAMTELDRHKNKIPPPRPVDWYRQMSTVHVFDELIYNTDRNLGNLVITSDWQIWMIDHTRAFRRFRTCRNLRTLRQIDRALLERLRSLETGTMKQHLAKYLSNSEIEAIMARRNEIVKHFDEQITSRGETAVLFDHAGPQPLTLQAARMETAAVN